MFHTLNKNEQEHETLKYTRETIKSLLFDDEFKVLTCHSQLGALSEYHSDSVCTHGRTKTSWLSLMRGVELKHPVETNFHCQHLIHFISLLMLTYMNIYEHVYLYMLYPLVFMVEMFKVQMWSSNWGEQSWKCSQNSSELQWVSHWGFCHSVNHCDTAAEAESSHVWQ